MQVTAVNTDIPEWLHPHMKYFCDCGGVFCDDGPIDEKGVMKLTQRWCSNPYCPHHMAEKVDALAKYFGVEGVGPKTAYDDIRMYKMRNHLEVLKMWFREKPSVYLYQAAELSYLYGVDSKWKEWLGAYNSYESYLADTRYVPDIITDNLEYLKECASYFDIKKSTLNKTVIKIMLTGSMSGFTSRKNFLDALNEEYKDYFRIEDNKKTVRDTICLVKEPTTTDHGKTQIALANRIPIVTSLEFISILENMKGEMQNADA